MGTLFGIKAFAVAILGGIESAWGVVLAGPHLRRRRGADHRAARLDLHADRHLRAGHRRAGGAAERPVRPRRGAEGMSWRAAAAAALVTAAVVLPHRQGATATSCSSSSLVGLTAIVGVGLNVLLGLSGQISLGHVAFYAIGAYAVGILTTKRSIGLLARAAAGGRRRRRGGRAAGDSGAARARALSRHGDHRLRLRRRAGRGRVAGSDRRLERPFRHSRRRACSAPRSARTGIAISRPSR